MADWFASAFGSLPDDFFAKLVMEGWSGRQVAEPKAQSDDLGWSRGGHPGHSPEPQHDAGREPPHDHGLER